MPFPAVKVSVQGDILDKSPIHYSAQRWSIFRTLIFLERTIFHIPNKKYKGHKNLSSSRCSVAAELFALYCFEGFNPQTRFFSQSFAVTLKNCLKTRCARDTGWVLMKKCLPALPSRSWKWLFHCTLALPDISSQWQIRWTKGKKKKKLSKKPAGDQKSFAATFGWAEIVCNA